MPYKGGASDVIDVRPTRRRPTMGRKYYETVCGDFAFHCEYFRAEPLASVRPLATDTSTLDPTSVALLVPTESSQVPPLATAPVL